MSVNECAEKRGLAGERGRENKDAEKQRQAERCILLHEGCEKTRERF